MMNISVLGAGSWGTALAVLLADKGYNVTLWVFEKDIAEEIAEKRENKTYLPGLRIPENIAPTNSLEASVRNQQVILNVIPTQYVRQVLSHIKSHIKNGQSIVSASKGIEKGSLLTVSGLLKSLFHDSLNLAVLSGPSFSKEVIQQHPTAVTLASEDHDLALMLQKIFNTHFFRVYTNDDVMGVELGGSLKNVIAIAAGISDGLGFGFNTRAALITRGLAEIIRLGVKMGAKEKTFSGLSGLGDLILTCTGNLSRNRTVGIQLGRGQSLKAILENMNMVAEGIETTLSARQLSLKMDVETPIVEQVYKVLYEDKPPKEAVKHLMTRAFKEEFDG